MSSMLLHYNQPLGLWWFLTNKKTKEKLNFYLLDKIEKSSVYAGKLWVLQDVLTPKEDTSILYVAPEVNSLTLNQSSEFL